MEQYPFIEADPIVDFSFQIPQEYVLSANKLSEGVFAKTKQIQAGMRGSFMRAKEYIQNMTDLYLRYAHIEPIDTPVGEIFYVGGLGYHPLDPANYHPAVEKFVVDRFVKAGILTDDDGGHIPVVSFCPLPQVKRTQYEFRLVFYKL